MLHPTRANYEDGYREKGLRRRLVESLRQKGISDEAVLQAINTVPRHVFFEKAFFHHAYQDKAFPIGAGQTISQPYTVAFQTAQIHPAPGMKVLEIGTGSGYQCAVLCQLGLRVVTIEYQEALYRRTIPILENIGYRPEVALLGDGSGGVPAYAPYQAIICTAGAPSVPERLLQQLSPGGRMIIPVGNQAQQEMTLVVKGTDGTVTHKSLGLFRFVPLLGRDGWQP